jgi:hypothetical protein
MFSASWPLPYSMSFCSWPLPYSMSFCPWPLPYSMSFDDFPFSIFNPFFMPIIYFIVCVNFCTFSNLMLYHVVILEGTKQSDTIAIIYMH